MRTMIPLVVEIAKEEAIIIITMIADNANKIMKSRVIIFLVINSENVISKSDERNPFGSIIRAPLLDGINYGIKCKSTY